MKIDCIDDLQGLRALSGAWDAVLSQSSHDHVCFSFTWLSTWWQAFGKTRRLMILTARDGNNTVRAIAPLMQSRVRLCGLAVRRIGFIYNDNASRADLIDGGCNGEMVRDTVSYLTKNASAWDVVDLENIWEGSQTYKNLIDALKEARLCFCVKDGLHSPYVSVQGDWQAYFSSRSKNVHKTFRNIRNRLKNKGPWSVENGRSMEDNALARIYSISRQSWKGRCRKDITASAEDKDFYELLTDTTGKQGWLHLWFLKVNNEYVAYEYALEYKNRMYALKADFNESYRDLAPGIMLHTHIMKYCFEHGIKEYDLCGHDEDYKKRWATQIRSHKRIVIYRSGLYGRLLYFLDYRTGYCVKAMLKRSSALKRLKRYIARRVG